MYRCGDTDAHALDHQGRVPKLKSRVQAKKLNGDRGSSGKGRRSGSSPGCTGHSGRSTSEPTVPVSSTVPGLFCRYFSSVIIPKIPKSVAVDQQRRTPACPGSSTTTIPSVACAPPPPAPSKTPSTTADLILDDAINHNYVASEKKKKKKNQPATERLPSREELRSLNWPGRGSNL